MQCWRRFLGSFAISVLVASGPATAQDYPNKPIKLLIHTGAGSLVDVLGRIVGQKRPLQPKHVWSIRVRLEMAENPRDLALFNMAIDSRLRGCDLVWLRVKGRVRGRPGAGAHLDHPAQDGAAGSVRDHLD